LLGNCQCDLCEAYYRNGQLADAYEACKKALNYLPLTEPESCWDTAWKLGLKENVINSIKGHNLHAASWSVSLQQWIVGPDGFNTQLSYYSNELGRYDDAIVAAKREIELRPNNYIAFVYLGVAYEGKKQYDEAIAAAKRSIEIKPSGFAYGTLATIYTAQKQYNDAIAAYKKAIELDPKNISNYFELSNCYVAKEDYVSAIAITERAQELAPDNADIPFAIGSFYMRMGKFDEAISSLNKAISLRTMTGVGIQIAIEGNYPVVKSVMEGPAKKAGMEVGDKIIKINGQSTKGWAINKVSQAVKGAEGTQVVLAIERKNLDNLIEKTVTRETIIEKSAAPIFGLRSLAYRTRGNTEDAEKDAEKAYSLDPNNDGAKGALGAIYLDKGKYDDTIKILSNTSKDNYFARILEATAYAKTSGYKKAVQIYSSIPEDYLISTNALRQRYKGAILEALTPYADAKKDSAKSLAAKGQYKEALKEYAEALKIADDNDAKKIRNNIAGLIKKNPYLAELPEEGRRYAIRAEASTKEGKFEDAVKEYKEAIKVAPYFPALYKAIALNYAELKEYRQAINNLKIYLDLSPDAPDTRAVKDNIYKWEFLMEKGGK
ncbi:MAG: tetratricopeptide repeat protein, partial [Nitrospiraceae bacterium]|nr:tetratricopeptide repeat protein [Nitrospiraceae bacterium]